MAMIQEACYCCSCHEVVQHDGAAVDAVDLDCTCSYPKIDFVDDDHA